MSDFSKLTAITVEECLTLDINELARAGLLQKNRVRTYMVWKKPGTDEELHRIEIEISPYGHSGLKHMSITHCNSAVHDQSFVLVQSKLVSGGLRWWFKCPGITSHKLNNNCIGRVGKLYMPPGERDFACRDCHSLTYDILQKGKLNGAFRTFEQLQKR